MLIAWCNVGGIKRPFGGARKPAFCCNYPIPSSSVTVYSAALKQSRGCSLIRYNIVDGDKTTADGIAIASSNSCLNMGKALVMLGDYAECPKCNSKGRIVGDGPRRPTKLMGRQPALNNDLCMCSCEEKPRLINSLSSLWEEVGPDEAGKQCSSASAGIPGAELKQGGEPQLGRRFQFVDSETQEPLANRRYVANVDGQTRHGVTDESGFADIDGRPGSDIQVHLVFKAPTGNLKIQEG
ncbi:PAAR domain-containing protein [Paraburkholderia phenoliruptrix]|uniref:PAAR domain-containing protein n=1 Tax=Paraburkholderia phenoliruptrix TaxID=252970 RepID=UPI00286C5591|nr:PAAR domain-containing protein [Paraburkholderia phenoliruptrix]